MSTPPPQDDNQWSEGPLLPRWVLWIMLPGIIAPMLIFAFILITESAHDEEDCPYSQVERRELEGGVAVLEERRSCVSGVEERRYSLLRDGESRVLGRRRFDGAAFGPDRYRWKAEISEQQEVVVTIQNDGHDDLLLREGTPEERAKGISY
ncbi:MAG: hypothetical protein OXT09_20140 [Myxococcales bacterium]|nr:hypothetical protein [Myxococcales bacterium]